MRTALSILRKVHLYLGVFTAPAILFFAFSGALQTFGLNDAARDGSYRPPHWLSVLAQIHKKQSAQLPQRKPGPQAAPSNPTTSVAEVRKKPVDSAQAPPPPERAAQHHPLPLRIFFLAVCVSLVASTVTGIWMSWAYRRDRYVFAGLFLAGLILPLILLKL